MVKSFRFIVLLTFLLPALAVAQNATMAGTVTDNSGGVVPGVTVTVTDIDTGRSQTTVTNENGQYRFPILPAGNYRLAAEIPGFASVVMEGLELLVGQTAQIPLQLGLAGVEETVTVTGESPLVDVLSSEVAGNVDRRMMDDRASSAKGSMTSPRRVICRIRGTAPIQGRNWMGLALLVKGSPETTPLTIDPVRFVTSTSSSTSTARILRSRRRALVLASPSFLARPLPSSRSWWFSSTSLRAAPPGCRSTRSPVPARTLSAQASTAISGTNPSTVRTSSRGKCFRSRTSRSAAPSVGPSCRTSSTTSYPTSTSVNLNRCSPSRRTFRASLSAALRGGSPPQP